MQNYAKNDEITIKNAEDYENFLKLLKTLSKNETIEDIERYKKIINIHHSELETTNCSKDSIYLNNVKCKYGKRFTLGFIMENVDKSTNKLIEKINEKNE